MSHVITTLEYDDSNGMDLGAFRVSETQVRSADEWFTTLTGIKYEQPKGHLFGPRDQQHPV